MIINPIIYVILLWTSCLILILISPIRFNELSDKFYVTLFIALISFIVGYLSYFITIKEIKVRITNNYTVNIIGIVKLQLIMIISLIFLTFLNIYFLTGSFTDFGQYRYIMTELATTTIVNKITPFFMPIIFMGIPILLYIKAKRKHIFLFTIFLIIYFIISGSRSVFMVIILILSWYAYFNKILKIRHLLLISLVIIIGFSLLGLLLGKLSLEEEYLDHFYIYINDDINRNFFTLSILSILKYMLGGIVAFSELTKIYTPSYDFNLLLLNFTKLTSFLGFSPSVKIIEYVEIPFKFNVYTWFYNSYLDFGYLGVIFTFIFFGFLGSYLFDNYKKNNIFVIYLSLYYTIITLSIFHDYIYSSLYPYTSALYLWAIKKIYFKKEN